MLEPLDIFSQQWKGFQELSSVYLVFFLGVHRGLFYLPGVMSTVPLVWHIILSFFWISAQTNKHSISVTSLVIFSETGPGSSFLICQFLVAVEILIVEHFSFGPLFYLLFFFLVEARKGFIKISEPFDKVSIGTSFNS